MRDDVRPTSPAFLAAGGETGALMRALDWSQTPLGPPERWPQALRTLTALILQAKQPLFAAWGPELCCLYNDACIPIFGGKHPSGMGRPFAEVWSDIWEQFRPIVEATLAGDAQVFDDLPVTTARNGYAEDAFFTFGYTQLRDEDDAVCGFFCAATETTSKVLFEREVVAERTRLQDLFQQAPGFMAVLRGPDHVFELVNDAYLQLVGHRDLLGKPVREALPEIEGQGFFELLDGVYSTGEAFVGRQMRAAVQRLPGAAPEVCYVDLVYQPVVDAAGKVTGIFVEGGDVTDIHAAQEALRAERDLSQGILASIDEAFVLFDRDFRVLEINGEGVRLYGRPADEIVGRHMLEVWPETAELPVWPACRQAMASRHPVELTYRHLSDIRDVWVEARAYPSGDGLAVLYRDVTERKLAELAVSESEQELHRLADSLPLLVSYVDRDERYRFNNRAYEDWFGRKAEDLCGRTVREVIGEPAYAALSGQIARALAGERFATEQTVPYKDGGVRDMRADYVPRIAEDGSVEGYYAIVQDIGDRKRAEDAVRVAREKAEALAAERAAILGQLAEGVIITDPAGRITFVNDAATRIHGVAALDVAPEDYSDTYHLLTEDGAPYPPEDLPLARAVLRDETVTESRWRIARPDGTEVVAVGSARPVHDADGAKLGAVLTLRDDTARHAAEAALRELNETLEARVEERTVELRRAEEQLRQAQKMEAVGQLTGGIAHDFNNLLQGITGSLDLVQKRVAQGRTNDLDRFISGAVTSANRAAALTHRLLAFSRRQPLDPKAVDANPLMASMEDLLRRTLGENIELELVMAGGLWRTLCDPNQLESAILNLAINARDAMPDGGKLTIETCNAHLDDAYAARTRDVSPGQYVCVCVTDTGSGMAPDVIERAFDPFFTTKAIGQGTGLGLSMIYGFARQSEGYCKIYSEVGRGTTIKLYLPRHRGEAAPDDPAAGLSEAHEAHEGEVVVVVEDEPVVRSLIVEVLAELGYRALEAHDGPSGLALLESASRVDLLITDIGLPGLNGRQVADGARARRPELKVLFMTGYAENAAIANGFLEPGMSMITKPFSMETLATRIRGLIEGD